MSSEVKWIRIGEATRTIPTVRSKSLAFELMKHQKKYLDPEKGLTIPGAFVNEACTSLKVFSTEVTREKRGKIRRRQRTKSFPRRREYAEANALDAAVAFKERMDAAARAGIPPEPDYATMTVDGVCSNAEVVATGLIACLDCEGLPHKESRCATEELRSGPPQVCACRRHHAHQVHSDGKTGPPDSPCGERVRKACSSVARPRHRVGRILSSP